jgi:hypothetical protein
VLKDGKYRQFEVFVLSEDHSKIYVVMTDCLNDFIRGNSDKTREGSVSVGMFFIYNV